MRKDVKLGFAIGGVLLAVAIVFALVNTAHPTKPNDEVAEGSGTSTTVQPESGTADSSKPAVVPEPATPAKPEPAVADAAKPEPAKADAAAEKKDSVFGGSTNWEDSFKTGLPVMAASNTSVALPEPAEPKVTSPKPAGPVSVGAPGVSFGSGRATTPGDADDVVRGSGNTANQPVKIVATSSTARAATTHTIRAGETFSTIAAAYYGNAKYHKLITAANPRANSSNLKIGQIITLPAFDPKTEAAKTATVVSAAEKPVDAKKEYRVQAGDNLHRICMKLYGNPKNVDAIYTLNKAAIGSDPAKLKLGMVLALPAAPTTASR